VQFDLLGIDIQRQFFDAVEGAASSLSGIAARHFGAQNYNVAVPEFEGGFVAGSAVSPMLVAVGGGAKAKPRGAAEAISSRQTKVERKRSTVDRDPWRASKAGSEGAI